MPSGLQASAFLVSDILSGPFFLDVPVYQRSYAWTRDEAGQLLDDLMEASGIEPEANPEPDYFLGSILLMDSAEGSSERLGPRMAPREFDIVDGQQRLVTMLTMLAVLRDLEKDARGPIARRVAAMVTAQKGPRFFRTERPRIHLTSRDRDFFERYVLEPGGTLLAPPEIPEGPEAPLYNVRDHLVAELSEYTQAERRRFFNYVIENCEVVVILSEDIDQAYRKFIVLNERGKKLQRNDILKADVISRLASEDIEWAVRDWDLMSARLGDEFETFFSHVRTIYGHTRPQIVSAVRAVMREEGGAAPFLRSAFLPLANTYAAIRTIGKDPQDALTERMRWHLTYLNRHADGDWAPAAMLALKNRQEDAAAAEALLGEIDRVAHLLRLLCLGTGKRKRRFGEIVSALRRGEAPNASHPVFEFTREDVRNIAFHLRDLHKRNQKMCKLLLLRLNDEISGRATPVNPDDYTIEHILPQRPPASSEWRKWFPTAEERTRFTESLGNLVLVTQRQNDKAKNANFFEKKKIFSEGDVLPITADVLKCAEWHPFEIEAREEHLLDVIRSTWRVDLPRARSVAAE